MRLVVIGLLLIVAGTLAWSWTLQKDVIGLIVSSEFSNNRIAKLEGMLTSTGEDMNESELAMQVKIKELYSEVDKLWASAWRRNKATLEEHDKALAALKKQTQGVAGNKTRINQLIKTQTELTAQLGDAKQLADTLEDIRTQQGLQEAVIGRLNRELDTVASRQAGINDRIGEAEDWVQSNLEFRKQTQRRLSEVEARTGVSPGR